MSKMGDGGPAFPAQFFDERATGMTLRDYLAAKAMNGDIASMQPHEDPADAANHIAKRAYAVADAMLKAREKS